jgi:hypothetical protein
MEPGCNSICSQLKTNNQTQVNGMMSRSMHIVIIFFFCLYSLLEKCEPEWDNKCSSIVSFYIGKASFIGLY